MIDFLKQRWGAVLALVAVSLAVLVVLFDPRTAKSGNAPSPQLVDAPAVMTPCRSYAQCLDRCVMVYRSGAPGARDGAAVRVCSDNCEKAANEEGRIFLRSLRQCEEQHCKDEPMKPDDTPTTITHRAIECSKQHCGSERIRCGLLPDEA